MNDGETGPRVDGRRYSSNRSRAMSAVWRLLFIAVAVVPGVAWAASDDSDSDDSGATPQFTQTVTVRPGKATQFDHFFSLKDDCTKDEDPKIAISTEPKHGKFSARPGQDVPKFSADSDFVSCNGKLTPSIQFYYQPSASYTGDDQVVLELTFPDGYVENETYNFRVK
jgi:hypothetical protein